MGLSVDSKNTLNADVSRRLLRIIRIHFNKNNGAPYWLDRQKELGVDILKSVQGVEDLSILGPMDEEALARRPVEDFIPRLFEQRKDYILAETAGTLGKPKFAIHREDEFQSAFITPFAKVAGRISFPRNCHWLFVGPTGPHVIGRAARGSAWEVDAGDVFTVDFDPRWAKKLPVGSFAAQRYLEHIEAQALHVLAVQNIGVLFSTPVVLNNLAEKMERTQRSAIKGLHVGGLSAGPEFMDKMSEYFPNAVVLAGYGNTLFGMIPQLNYNQQTGFDYFPHGHRLIVKVVPSVPASETVNLNSRVAYGERGQLVIHRLDEMQFIANLVERDTAIRLEPIPDAAADGFVLDGFRDPQPIIDEKIKPSIGFY